MSTNGPDDELSMFDTVSRAEEGVRMPVVTPDGGPTKMAIIVAGADSKRVQRVQDKNWEKKRLSGRRSFLATGPEGRNDRLEVAVAATVNWEGFTKEGKPIACTPDNVRNIYDKYPAIQRQVLNFMDDEANFMPASPDSSSTSPDENSSSQSPASGA